MAILLSNEIKSAVIKELLNAEASVQIITAYCKSKTFKSLDEYINPNITNKRLLVRFRMDDIVKGSTDFDILQYGITHGWKIYIRFDLHAKTYIVDHKRGIIGSANATNLGLSMGKHGNMEVATLAELSDQDNKKINGLFDDAIEVSQEIMQNMYNQLKDTKSGVERESFRWDSNITSLFHPHVETVFSHEFPDDTLLVEGTYLPFVDEVFSGDLEAFKDSLRWSNAYMWLLDSLKKNNGSMYFGELSEKLHNDLVTDPKPYRRDVKEMLSNLLSLIDQVGMEEVTIDRPNYSQRVSLVKNGL